jgi:hypothetical protein
MSTIVEMSENLTEALRKEIDLLAGLPERERLDIETFDPRLPSTCFLGQMFLQKHFSGSGRAKEHRQQVGAISPQSGTDFRTSGTMTPLEVWSAEMWQAGNKEIVKQVFCYIKSGGEGDMPNVCMKEDEGKYDIPINT